MAAKTREELVAEYQQYDSRELNNLDAILHADLANYDQNIAEAPTPEWATFWQGMKKDAQLELSVCMERMQQPAN